jgi:hypothetical protein
MEIGVLTYTNSTGHTILAQVHITNFIVGMTGGNLIDSGIKPERYDILFVVAGIFRFCSYREQVLETIEKAGRVIYLENDYTIPIPFKRTPDEFWSTVVRDGAKYINWNSLTYIEGMQELKRQYADGLLYYGRWRDGRKEYLEKWLQKKPYKVYVSTSRKQMKKFKVLLKNSDIIFDKMTHSYQLSLFGCSIYMEDKSSHKTFMSPANRFYECLSHGIAMGIDENAAHTLIEAGMPNVEKYIVRTDADIENLILNSRDIAREQAQIWKRDYRAEIKIRFNELFKEAKEKWNV